MKTRKLMTQCVFILFMLVLVSCGGGSAKPQDPTPTPETIVVETLQTSTQPAPQPTEVLTNIAFEDIRFYLDGQLARTVSYEITAAPDPANDDPFQLPSYYQFNFEGFVIEDPINDYPPIQWRQPRLYVIPVENMQAFPGGGFGLETLATLQQILSTQPAAISETMPTLPAIHFNNGEIWHANLRYLDFQNGSGVRFLVEYGQMAVEFGHATSYVFQGLTSDGGYYISLTLPVNFTVLDEYNLPHTVTDQASYAAFSENLASYQLGALAILNSSPDAAFTPDLAALDALVQTLIVKP